jgi:ankyrin repeat protein
MDELLNVEFLECDPLTRRDGETPIHCAVKYANEREVELGEAMAKMLIEAGGDPRVKDKHGRKPAELCTPRTEELRGILTKEEYVLNEGLKNADVHPDEDDQDAGPPSDDD